MVRIKNVRWLKAEYEIILKVTGLSKWLPNKKKKIVLR